MHEKFGQQDVSRLRSGVNKDGSVTTLKTQGREALVTMWGRVLRWLEGRVVTSMR